MCRLFFFFQSQVNKLKETINHELRRTATKRWWTIYNFQPLVHLDTNSLLTCWWKSVSKAARRYSPPEPQKGRTKCTPAKISSDRCSNMSYILLLTDFPLLILKVRHSVNFIYCCLPVSPAAGEKVSSQCCCLSHFSRMCRFVLTIITRCEFGLLTRA